MTRSTYKARIQYLLSHFVGVSTKERRLLSDISIDYSYATSLWKA